MSLLLFRFFFPRFFISCFGLVHESVALPFMFFRFLLFWGFFRSVLFVLLFLLYSCFCRFIFHFCFLLLRFSSLIVVAVPCSSTSLRRFCFSCCHALFLLSSIPWLLS